MYPKILDYSYFSNENHMNLKNVCQTKSFNLQILDEWHLVNGGFECSSRATLSNCFNQSVDEFLISAASDNFEKNLANMSKKLDPKEIKPRRAKNKQI